jgi:hypothetical protein
MIKSDESYELDGELHDAVELTSEYKSVIKAVENQVDDELKDFPLRRCMGFGHIYCERIAQILREEHGIIWRSPAEMNPWNCYD